MRQWTHPHFEQATVVDLRIDYVPNTYGRQKKPRMVTPSSQNA
jgi:hypothetical protein